MIAVGSCSLEAAPTVELAAFKADCLWSALCKSRRELSNEYLLAKIGVDTAENEPLEAPR